MQLVATRLIWHDDIMHSILTPAWLSQRQSSM